MGWQPCGGCGSCQGCSSPPATIDLVVPTVNELDICSCGGIAGTYTLSLDYDFGTGVGFDPLGTVTGTGCYWGGNFSPTAGCNAGTLDVFVQIGAISSSVRIMLYFTNGNGTGEWFSEEYFLSSNMTKDTSTFLDDEDCTANGTLTTASNVDIYGTPPDCQISSGSVFELNP